MFFRIFTKFTILEHFYHPQKKHCAHYQSFAIPPSPQALETTLLLSVSMDLPVLNIPYKWNHTYVVFCIWLISLSMFSRFIHVTE